MMSSAQEVINNTNKENARNLAALRARVKKLRETGSTPTSTKGIEETPKALGIETTPFQRKDTADNVQWMRILDGIERHCYVKLDRTSYQNFDKAAQELRRDSENVEAWVKLMNYLKSPNVKHHVPEESILRLYEKATRSLNLRENRKNKLYIQLWLSYAGDLAKASPEDARDAFKYMRAHRIGEDSAELYETWALFEVHNGNPEKAKKLFEEASTRKDTTSPLTTVHSGKPPLASIMPSKENLHPKPDGFEKENRDEGPAKKRGRTPLSVRKPLLSGGPARRVRHGGLNSESTDGEKQVSVLDENNYKSEKSVSVDFQSQPFQAPQFDAPSLSKLDTSLEERPPMFAAEAEEVTPSISSAVKRLRLASTEKPQKTESWSTLWTTYKNDTDTKSSGSESPELSRSNARAEDIQDEGPIFDVNDSEKEEENRGSEKAIKEHSVVRENYVRALSPMHENTLETARHQGERKAAPAEVAPSPTPSVLNAMNDAVLHVNDKQFLRLEMVGRGGSSKVYKVMGPDRKIYALKKVRIAKKDQATIASYANEIKLLMRLRGKPHIVQLFDAEVREDAGLIYVIMEFGDIDLARLLSRGRGKPVNTNFLRLYWQQMLEAVHTIHEERIVHGDLKPANFLLVEGALKLIDFGIAKAIQNDDTTNIVRDSQVGTPNYMSPEALLCAPDGSSVETPGDPSGRKKYKLGRASDLWSLGCILYQMVFGKTPFAHLSMIQKLHCITDPSYEIQFPAVRNTYLLEDLQKCLQRDPNLRPSIPELLKSRFLFPDQRPNAHDDGGNSAGAGENFNGVSRDMLSSILEQLKSMDVDIPDNVLSDPTLVDKLLSRFRLGSEGTDYRKP